MLSKAEPYDVESAVVISYLEEFIFVPRRCT